jgi:hypothetical protein
LKWNEGRCKRNHPMTNHQLSFTDYSHHGWSLRKLWLFVCLWLSHVYRDVLHHFRRHKPHKILTRPWNILLGEFLSHFSHFRDQFHFFSSPLFIFMFLNRPIFSISFYRNLNFISILWKIEKTHGKFHCNWKLKHFIRKLKFVLEKKKAIQLQKVKILTWGKIFNSHALLVEVSQTHDDSAESVSLRMKMFDFMNEWRRVRRMKKQKGKVIEILLWLN